LRNEVGLVNPKLAVSFPNVSAMQPISGEHLVRPDGTVQLGVYGSVYVTEMTLEEAKSTLETHLAKFIHEPVVNINVLSYNSKCIYIVFDSRIGGGENVMRLSFVGSQTVLDALGQFPHLGEIPRKKIWVARPDRNNAGPRTLPVDWKAITRHRACRRESARSHSEVESFARRSMQ
jgi:hypothetical protein